MDLTESAMFIEKHGYVHRIGVAPDSHTKSPQELIQESNFNIAPNVDSFSSLF
jgi:hypothetical protein